MGIQKNYDPTKKLEWGDHNPQLTEDNFIDGNRKKMAAQSEPATSASGQVDLSKEEPGRNRKGVREGEHK